MDEEIELEEKDFFTTKTTDATHGDDDVDLVDPIEDEVDEDTVVGEEDEDEVVIDKMDDFEE